MPVSMIDQLRMLRDWAPLIGYARRYASTDDPHERALVGGDAIEWIASKTENTLDDRIARHLAAVLKTPEAAGLVRELLDIVDAIPKELVK